MTQALRPKNFKQQVYMRDLRVSLDGNHKVAHGITMIRGVGRRFAQAAVKVAGIDPDSRIGALAEKDLKKIEEIILEPVKHGIPKWMVNRNKDLRTGSDLHLIGNRLELTVKRDIERMKKMRSYKGVRHAAGLKVRGQKTKSTGRHGLVIGVIRKKLKSKKK